MRRHKERPELLPSIRNPNRRFFGVVRTRISAALPGRIAEPYDALIAAGRLEARRVGADYR